MGKITDISGGRPADYMTLSKTPKNRDHGNFYFKELQDKFDAEWGYAPDVVDVDYEATWGLQDYRTIEVRDQKVRGDKQKAYSDDSKRLVFRDIFEKRFKIGSKFRFSDKFDMEVPDGEKSIWLVTNMTYANPNTSVVVTRCNGRMGFMVKDDQGISKPFYEPAIFGSDLKGVAYRYSETAVSLEAELTAVVQHNERTATFYKNQRFVVGYDQVYRVKGINKFYSEQTFDPHAPGLVLLYLELTEQSPKDVFGDVDIAYEEHSVITMDEKHGDGEVSIEWTLPKVFPTLLPMEATEFSAVVRKGDEELAANVAFSWSLENLPVGVDPTKYVDFSAGDGNSFSIKRKKQYLNGGVVITATVPASEFGGEADYSVSFRMGMSGI